MLYRENPPRDSLYSGATHANMLVRWSFTIGQRLLRRPSQLFELPDDEEVSSPVGFFPKHRGHISGSASVLSHTESLHSFDEGYFHPHHVFCLSLKLCVRKFSKSKPTPAMTGGRMEWSPPVVHLEVFCASTSPTDGLRHHVFARHSRIWSTLGLPRAPAAAERSGPNAASKLSCKEAF